MNIICDSEEGKTLCTTERDYNVCNVPVVVTFFHWNLGNIP